MNLRKFADRVAYSRLALAPAVLLAASPAVAQDAVGSGITTALCRLLKPFVGNNSQILSLLFLIGLGVLLVMWFLNENKEGVMLWLLRSGIVMGVLINIFTLPPMIGLPSVCG